MSVYCLRVWVVWFNIFDFRLRNSRSQLKEQQTSEGEGHPRDLVMFTVHRPIQLHSYLYFMTISKRRKNKIQSSFTFNLKIIKEDKKII